MGVLARLRQPDALIARWPLQLRHAIVHSTPAVRGLWLLVVLVAVLMVLNITASRAQSQLQQRLSALSSRLISPSSNTSPNMSPSQASVTPTVASSSSGKSASGQATTADTPTSAISQWPLHAEAEPISAEILALADAMGMIFERAEFQVMPGQGATLQELRIKLPLKGDYEQIRQFLAQVLHRYPSLALSQCKLQRSDVMQAEIDAQIEFSLYTRKGGL